MTILSTPVLSSDGRAQEEFSRPNVLLIVTDDQRWDTYSAMPHTRELLRDHAIDFRHAVVTTPMCCPSRASIMSGQYVHNHGVDGMGNPEALNQQHTMQYQLQQAGYRTGIVGKYLNSWNLAPPFFDRWATSNPRQHYMTDVTFNVDGTSVSETNYITNFEQKMALSFLNDFMSDPAQPWMLYVAPYAPHLPALSPRRYWRSDVKPYRDNPARLEGDLSDKPEYVQEAAIETAMDKVIRWRTKQLRSLRAVDDLIANLIVDLSEAGMLDNTLIVFTSDNGFHWYEHQLARKYTPYEASVRVPLLVRWGDRFDHVDRRLVANIDIAPTIYEATGVTPDYTVDGRSLFSDHVRDRILMEMKPYRRYPQWDSFYAKGWRYTEYPETGEREYYGRDDPWELDNVFGNDTIGDEPPEGAKLAAELAIAKECSGDSCP